MQLQIKRTVKQYATSKDVEQSPIKGQSLKQLKRNKTIFHVMTEITKPYKNACYKKCNIHWPKRICFPELKFNVSQRSTF